MYNDAALEYRHDGIRPRGRAGSRPINPSLEYSGLT